MQKKWQKAEKLDEKRFGAKRQRGSGNTDHYPADNVNDLFAIETKQTDKGSYSISIERWLKLVEETAVLNSKDKKLRIPLMSVHLNNLHLCVISFEDLRQFLQTNSQP